MKVKIVAALAAVALIAGCGSSAHTSSKGASLPANVAFKFGSRSVTVDQLNARDKALTALYGIQKPAGGSALDEFNRQAAKSMAINLVLDQAIAARHITVSDREVQQAQQALITSEFKGSASTFTEEIAKVGVSQATVTDEIRRQLALRILLAQVAGDVSATDAEIAAAYPAHRFDLGTPERRVVYNIVVADQATAAQVRQTLDAGASVTAVAKQVSIDGATRNKGGLLGTVARSQLLPAVGTAVFEAKAGSAYGPVEGEQGWNVGMVTKVVPGIPASLKAALPSLRAIVIDQKKQAVWSKWLAAQLRAANVQYAAAYLPKDPFSISAWKTPGSTTSGAQ